MEKGVSFAALMNKTRSYSIADLGECVADTSKYLELFPEYSRHLYRLCGVYMFDYTKFQYHHVDQQFSKIAERSKNYILDNGLGPKEKIWYEPDQEIFREKMLTQNLSFFKDVPPDIQQNYLITCTYRNRRKDGGFKRIMQQSFVVRSTEEGIPLAVIGLVTDISDLDMGNRLIHTIKNVSNDSRGPEDYSDCFFSFEGDKTFSRQKIEVVKYLADGLTEKEIADKLFISIRTVENHKLQMRMLSNTKNTAELVAYAIRNGYIK